MPASSVHRAGLTPVDRQHSQPQNFAAGISALGQFALGISDWVYSLALIILAYQLTGSLAWVAGVLLLQAAGRLAVISFPGWFNPLVREPLPTVIGLIRPLLIASLLLVTSDDGLRWALAVTGLMGITGAVYDAARATVTGAGVSSEHKGLAGELASRPEQISMVVGSMVGGLLIVAWSVDVAFVAAAILGASGALILSRSPRNRAAQPTAVDGHPFAPLSEALRAMPAFRKVILALAVATALGIGLRVTLVDVVLDQHGSSELVYALMIAFAGLGTLYTPISVPRLLGKLGPELVLAATIVALSLALIFVQIARPLAIIVPVIFVCGMLAIIGDRVAETLTRRLIPDSALDGALRVLGLAAVTGQALALATLIAIGPPTGGVVAGLVLAGAGMISAVLILKGSMKTSLQRVRGNDPDERKADGR